jgi:hypothetical protein
MTFATETRLNGRACAAMRGSAGPSVAIERNFGFPEATPSLNCPRDRSPHIPQVFLSNTICAQPFLGQ